MFRKSQKQSADRRLVPDRRWCLDRRVAEAPSEEWHPFASRRRGDRRSYSVRRKSEL